MPPVATYLTGFGAAESLRHQLKNAGFNTLNYGYAFGLSIAGWCMAFIVFALGALELTANKARYSETYEVLVVAPSRPKRPVVVLGALPTPLARARVCVCVCVVSVPCVTPPLSSAV